MGTRTAMAATGVITAAVWAPSDLVAFDRDLRVLDQLSSAAAGVQQELAQRGVRVVWLGTDGVQRHRLPADMEYGDLWSGEPTNRPAEHPYENPDEPPAEFADGPPDEPPRAVYESATPDLVIGRRVPRRLAFAWYDVDTRRGGRTAGGVG